MGPKNVHVGLKRPSYRNNIIFLRVFRSTKFSPMLKFILNGMIHFKTPKFVPWGKGRVRGKPLTPKGVMWVTLMIRTPLRHVSQNGWWDFSIYFPLGVA